VEPVIRRLFIEGFRSIRSEVVEFDNPTFLVGRNGSGKSNLIDALAFLSDSMSSSLPSILMRRGGGWIVGYAKARSSSSETDQTLGIGVILGAIGDEITEARYSFEIAPTGYRRSTYHVLREQCVIERQGSRRDWFERRHGTPFQTNADGLRPQLTDEALALPLVGGDSRFAPVAQTLGGIRAYSITPERVRERQIADSGRILHGDGDNMASVLRLIQGNDPDDLQRICEIMNAIVPEFRRVEVTMNDDGRLGLKFTQRWGDGPNYLTLDGTCMSEGTARALGLMTAVYQPQTPAVLAIEEPEATIHPGALGVILDVLRHASERTQVIVTTHSPEVLDADWLEDRHIRVVSWEDGATRVTPPDAGSREALRQHLMTAGELLRSRVLEGPPLDTDKCDEPKLFEDLVA
jgi:predicted ATPase